jgi:uncharacterized membrane protein YgcG
MKKQKIALLISSIIIGLFFITNTFAQQDFQNIEDYSALEEVNDTENIEFIDLMDVTMVVNPDSTVRVTETIEYDFGTKERHGIYRIIPLTNGVGTFDRLDIKDINVVDENGEEYQFSVNTPDNLPGKKTLKIKVGDPDNTITGQHTYIISYTAYNLLGYFDDRTEVYWNVTGNDWEVPILFAEAHIVLPKNIDKPYLKTTSYCGDFGSSKSCGENTISYEYNDSSTQINFISTNEIDNNPLYLGQGMTVAVGFPNGLVYTPSTMDKVARFFKSYWPFLFPFLITFFWFRKSIAYFIRRRSFYRNNTIIPEYDPGDMDPLEAAGILDGGIENKHLSAQIIYLATQGYLVIKNVDDEYVFEGTKKNADKLPGYTKSLLEGIVDKNESELTNDFYSTVTSIILKTMSSLRDRGYTDMSKISFGRPPSRMRGFPAIFLSLFLALNPGVFIWLLIGRPAGIVFSGSCILIGLVHFIVKISRNRLTDKGLEAERVLLGLKRYISVAEEERIKFHNAPEKNPELFEKLLPYAMIFGLEKKWAKEFENIYTSAPGWYPSFSGQVFSTALLVSSLKDFSASTTSSLFSSSLSYSYGGGGSSGSSFGSSGSSSGSSGGGSSGGGGGGGGGGSW